MAGGRSLHSSEGVLLYSEQSVFETAVLPAASVGIAEYNVTDDGDFRQFFTVGKKNLHKNKAGNHKLDWQVRIAGLGSHTLLDLGVRSAGLLPWITWGFGSDASDASPEAWQVQDSKVNQVEVSLDESGVLTGSLQGIGRNKTIVTTLTADAGDEDPLFAYEGWLTLNGSPFEVKSFRFTVDHNLLAEYPIRGTRVADNKLRLFSYLTEGNEVIEGSVTCTRAESKDFGAACPAADGDFVLTLKEACDASNYWAITLDEVELLSQARNMPQSGYGEFTIPFNAKGWSIADL